MLTVEALQVCLGAEPDGVTRPAGLAAPDGLRQQPVTQAAAPRLGRGNHPADGAAMLITNARRHDPAIGRQVPTLVAEQVQHPFAAIQPIQILERASLLHHEDFGPQGQQIIQFVRGQLGPGLETPVHRQLLID
ncbi:hypothetical protein D3C76_1505170 [compost metagenome]